MAVLASDMGEKISAANIKKETFLTAQDLKYARRLAENDPKIRKHALKHLKDYLRVRSQNLAWSGENLRILWKGLFYSMWMSDKPLVQEECAENIADLIHSFNRFKESVEFFRTGLITLQNEWFGIDQHRLDKFLMLVRRLLRQALIVLAKVNFRKKYNLEFAKVLEDTVLSTTDKVQMGIFMHFTEIYLEEVAKTSFKKLPKNRVIDLVRPFIVKLAFSGDPRETKWISKFVLTHLIKQHNLGIEYKEKYEVWRSLGFPGSITQIQKVKVSTKGEQKEEASADGDSNHLDPRAGRVDVELPPIYFDAAEIAETLIEYVGDKRTSATSRNILRSFSENFKKLAEGRYPLGVKKAKKVARDDAAYDVDVTKAAKKLMKFERKLMARDRKGKKRAGDEPRDGPEEKKKKTVAEGSKKKKKSKGEDADVRKSKRLKRIEQQIIEDMPYLKSLPDDADVEYIFKRNSGVWFVTSEPVERVLAPSPHVLAKLGLLPSETGKKEEQEEEDSDNVLRSDYKTTTVDKALAGGSEIVLPSPTKTDDQMSRTDRELKRIFDEFEGRSTNGGFSSQPLLLTPKPRLSTSPKKVRINTRMNVSQEIYEHVFRVVSSPQIPYDSTKKPTKPVLKPTRKAIPINPFYKLKKSFFDDL